MWELWVHPQASKYKETLFGTRKILWRIRSLTLSARNFLSQLQFFKVGEIIVSKYGHLMLPGAFPGYVTADIDFTGDAIVVKILL